MSCVGIKPGRSAVWHVACTRCQSCTCSCMIDVDATTIQANSVPWTSSSTRWYQKRAEHTYHRGIAHASFMKLIALMLHLTIQLLSQNIVRVCCLKEALSCWINDVWFNSVYWWFPNLFCDASSNQTNLLSIARIGRTITYCHTLSYMWTRRASSAIAQIRILGTSIDHWWCTQTLLSQDVENAGSDDRSCGFDDKSSQLRWAAVILLHTLISVCKPAPNCGNSA